MKHPEAKNKVYLCTFISFIIGATIGTVLFYSQLKLQKESTTVPVFTEKVTLEDALRLFYINLLWLISIFIAYRLVPFVFFQPIMISRGAVSTFSVLYVMNSYGVMWAARVILPQCFSILPIMAFFFYQLVEKYKKCMLSGNEFYIKRKDILFTIGLSAVATVVESGLFLAFSWIK